MNYQLPNAANTRRFLSELTERGHIPVAEIESRGAIVRRVAETLETAGRIKRRGDKLVPGRRRKS